MARPWRPLDLPMLQLGKDCGTMVPLSLSKLSPETDGSEKPPCRVFGCCFGSFSDSIPYDVADHVEQSGIETQAKSTLQNQLRKECSFQAGSRLTVIFTRLNSANFN